METTTRGSFAVVTGASSGIGLRTRETIRGAWLRSSDRRGQSQDRRSGECAQELQRGRSPRRRSISQNLMALTSYMESFARRDVQ